jgi:hypothetical protein
LCWTRSDSCPCSLSLAGPAVTLCEPLGELFALIND